MTSIEYDQQQYHRAAAGLGISQLALAAGSTTSPISCPTTTTERDRKCVRVRVYVCRRVRVCVRKGIWVPFYISGSSTERVLRLVGAVVSHMPDPPAVEVVTFT